MSYIASSILYRYKNITRFNIFIDVFNPLWRKKETEAQIHMKVAQGQEGNEQQRCSITHHKRYFKKTEDIISN